MQKTINLNGKALNFKTNASIPRVYRKLFNRDIFSDIAALQKLDKKNVSYVEIEPIENIAFTFAYLADNSILNGNVDDSVEEWLSQFEGFDIYTELSEPLIELWVGDNQTISKEVEKAKKLIGS